MKTDKSHLNIPTCMLSFGMALLLGISTPALSQTPNTSDPDSLVTQDCEPEDQTYRDGQLVCFSRQELASRRFLRALDGKRSPGAIYGMLDASAGMVSGPIPTSVLFTLGGGIGWGPWQIGVRHDDVQFIFSNERMHSWTGTLRLNVGPVYGFGGVGRGTFKGRSRFGPANARSLVNRTGNVASFGVGVRVFRIIGIEKSFLGNGFTDDGSRAFWSGWTVGLKI